jgi:hypothetical protein
MARVGQNVGCNRQRFSGISGPNPNPRKPLVGGLMGRRSRATSLHKTRYRTLERVRVYGPTIRDHTCLAAVDTRLNLGCKIRAARMQARCVPPTPL